MPYTILILSNRLINKQLQDLQLLEIYPSFFCGNRSSANTKTAHVINTNKIPAAKELLFRISYFCGYLVMIKKLVFSDNT